MKKLFFSLLHLFLALGFAQAQNALNMVRLGTWDDNSLPVGSPGNLNVQYSGCWGLAVNGHEYAVLGGAAHVLFFDVTVPAQPQLVGKFAGTTTTVWREFKSYKNRIYAVSDATTEGLMVFDLSHAEDTIVRTYWSNEFFERAHTITLDTVSGRIYLNGGSANQGMIVLDVSQNPDQPTLLANLPSIPGGYLHDSYVRNDTLYGSSGYDGYYIFDFKDPQNPVFLASVSTGGYNHNSWLNPEGTHAYYTEEIPQGQPVRVVDLQNLNVGEIEVVGGFLDNLTPNAGSLAVPHNVYIKDHLLFNSQYEDGLLVYDISNPTEPMLVAYYDTHPENSAYLGYFGNWGNYPWLPSGNIIAGDMQHGLQVLKITTPVSTQNIEKQLIAHISPNPATERLTIRLQSEAASTAWSCRLLNAAGQVFRSAEMENQTELALPLQGIPSGLYFVEIRDHAGATALRKVVVN
jgi:choice-of-anchor B domain-containing protein